MDIRKNLLVSACLAAAFAGLAGYAQQAAPPAAAPSKSENAFKTAVSEVIVPVTVTDDKGRFVRDLELKDFELYDEGKLQTISYFTRERNQPVVIGFLLDLSNANKLRWKEFQEAMVDLVMATLNCWSTPPTTPRSSSSASASSRPGAAPPCTTPSTPPAPAAR
jgi:hypothetical protein